MTAFSRHFFCSSVYKESQLGMIEQVMPHQYLLRGGSRNK